jgi:hypothetical protein
MAGQMFPGRRIGAGILARQLDWLREATAAALPVIDAPDYHSLRQGPSAHSPSQQETLRDGVTELRAGRRAAAR